MEGLWDEKEVGVGNETEELVSPEEKVREKVRMLREFNELKGDRNGTDA